VKKTKVTLVGLLMLTSLSWAQETAAPNAKSGWPGLAAGDEIDVHMFDFPDVGDIHVHINSDGSVHLPYAGTIQASGKSPAELQRAISDTLQAKGVVKSPNITVDVVSSPNLMVQVLGEVRTPRAIPVTSPIPISYLLGQVGGITGLASHQLTILHHSDMPPTSIDYDPDAPTSAAMNAEVLPGDIVNVSRLGVFFVTGEVNHPGIYPFGGAITIGQAAAGSGTGLVQNITLLQALAQAGGITSIAARSKMRILRTVDGKREEILVDEKKLYKGEVADPILHLNDIVYVPSSYIRLATNNIFSSALSGVYAAAQAKQF
jgi:polysaccharide export outer membrane protein